MVRNNKETIVFTIDPYYGNLNNNSLARTQKSSLITFSSNSSTLLCLALFRVVEGENRNLENV